MEHDGTVDRADAAKLTFVLLDMLCAVKAKHQCNTSLHKTHKH